MNLGHLGDALDYWKGGMIAKADGALRNLSVVPMLTDFRSWTPSHVECYASLLGVSCDRVLLVDTPFTSQSRSSYFARLTAVDPHSALFFDPDTGLACGKAKPPTHITIVDVVCCLPSGSDRVGLIYQHSHQREQPTYIQRVLECLAQAGLYAAAYDARGVAMIYACRTQRRIRDVTALLRKSAVAHRISYVRPR